MGDGIPLVSVIVPTFNRAGCLPACIESVLMQSYRRVEVVVVDDGSKDNTAEVVRKIGDKRVRYIAAPVNRGAAAARNLGIDSVQGEYITFLDSDDRYVQTKLAKQLEAMQGFDANVCGCVTEATGLETRASGRTEIHAADLKRGYWFGGGTSSLMVRRNLAERVRFDENLRSGEDWDLLVRIVQKTRLGYLDEPLVIYNDGDHVRITNQLANMPLEKLEEGTGVFRKHEEFLGSYWLKYNTADHLLSYLKHRTNVLGHIGYTIRRCGWVPVSAVLWNKIVSKGR